ncbi:hypothetical protein EQH57_0034 [Dictyocoela roeselum]|nr:hypothetical protein EQH57_0034 [Dictyocoela roeselum]
MNISLWYSRCYHRPLTFSFVYTDPSLAAREPISEQPGHISSNVGRLVKHFLKVMIDKVGSIGFVAHFGVLIEQIIKIGLAEKFATESVLRFLDEVGSLEVACF